MAKEVSDLVKALYPFAPESYTQQHRVGSPEAAAHDEWACKVLAVSREVGAMNRNKLVGGDKDLLDIIDAAQLGWRARR